jgi:hypothetical protein
MSAEECALLHRLLRTGELLVSATLLWYRQYLHSRYNRSSVCLSFSLLVAVLVAMLNKQ